MKLQRNHSTHMPFLMKAVLATNGDILEMGSGMFSTPLLHWMAYPDRKVYTYESNPEYYEMVSGFKAPHHEIILVDSWDDAPIEREWGLALIDHSPADRRKVDILRLANYAKMIFIHDTEPRNERKYGYNEVIKKFRYNHFFRDLKPQSAVVSNLEQCTIH